jgi:hypothetical protein
MLHKCGIGVLGVCAMLAACAETTPATDLSVLSATSTAAASDPMPTYGLRLRGEGAGMTSVSVFVRYRDEEREVLADRCTEARVDRSSPEGLLLPIDCDERRLVLQEERGRLVMPQARMVKAFGAKPQTPTALQPRP